MRSAVLPLALVSLTSCASTQVLSPEDRAAFREAVEQYRMFVVPHCAPDDVVAYIRARAGRDKTFVKSLRGTMKADYDQALASQSERDSRTVYECAWPPPPPGSAPPSQEELRLKAEKSRTGHFESGDRQFAKLIQLRDRLIGSAKR